MNENNVFEERTEEQFVPDKKKGHIPSLVVGILSIAFGLLFALAGDVLGIVGIAMSVSKRKDYTTKAGLICSIIGLVLAIGNHIIGALMMLSLAA